MTTNPTGLTDEEVKDISGFGIVNRTVDDLVTLWVYLPHRQISCVLDKPTAYHYSELFNKLPQFQPVRFSDVDHRIVLERDSLHHAVDDAGVIRMILLRTVEGNVYSKDQTIVIKSVEGEIKYKIDDLTELSSPRSCMLYVTPTDNEL